MLCDAEDIATTDLPDGLRQRDTGSERFLFNYSDSEISFEGKRIEPAGVLRQPVV